MQFGPRVYSFAPTTNKQIAITKRLATRYPELAPLSALGRINSHIQYARPELAPLSALGHISNHIQITTAQTSPFICFGAHQQPNSTTVLRTVF